MATIPMGENFGQAVARGPAPVNVLRGDPAGDAMTRAGAALGNVAAEEAQHNLKRQDDTRRAAAALALAKTQNAMHDVHDQVAQGVQDGTIPVDKAAGELQTRLGKVRSANLDGFDPQTRALMDAHVETTQGTLQRNLQGAVVKRQQTDAAGSIDQFGEQVSREAMRSGPQWAVDKYSSFLKVAGPLAGLNEEQQGKLAQKFSERTHADFYTNAGVAALTQGNDEQLRKLREQVQGPQGDPMDPKQRAVVTHTLFGWEQSILAKRDRQANQDATEAARRLTEAADTLNKGTDLALGGGYFSPEFISDMVTKASGTELAPAVERLISSQRTVAGFATRPAAERAAILERTRNERATPGVGTDPLADRFLDKMTAMDQKLRTQAEENPWAAAQGAGVIQSAPAFNLSDPSTAIATVQERMKQISQVEQWTGKRVSPFQPAEVEQFGKFVRQMPLDQAATMLANIGNAVGDGDRVAALGKQLHDKDGALGLAMMYASAQTTQGRKTAELVLRGDQALKDNTAMVDRAKETGWMASIAKQVRGAYSNREAEDQVIDAAYKITAANYADGKGADIDNAVNLATGGIIERNGQKAPLPYGMKEREFNQRIESIRVPDIEEQARDGNVYVGRTAMPVDKFVETLPKASLVHAGQGLYNVRAGTSLVTNAQGQRISIKVTP
jgi:hypothetical protein